MDSTRFSANRRFASCIRFNPVHLRLSIMSSPKVLILQAFSLNITSQNRAKGVILSQLSSSHLFIHRVLAKLSNRVVPYGVNYRKLQLLFVVWFLLTLWFCKVRFPADAYPASLNQSFRYDPRSMDLGQRVPFQNPAQFQKFLNLSRILEYCFALYFLCSQAFLPGFPPDIF